MGKKLACLVLGVGMLGVALPRGYAGALVAHWPFDGDGQDMSGNKNHATAFGNPIYGTGMSGQAVQFDSAGQYLQVVNNPGIQLLSGKGFTVAAYVNAANANQGNILIHGLGCSTWSSWFLGVQGGEPDGTLYADSFVFGVRTSSTDVYTGVTGPAVTGEWVYLAATHDGTTLKMFINGQETDSTAAPLPYNSAENLYVGGDPGCNGRSWYTGLVDDVYIFNRSLNAGQIQELAEGIMPSWLKAEDPDPADGAIGVTLPLLQWTKGETAAFHDVYVGTSPDLTAADLQPRGFGTMLYYMAGFTPGVTYFWRVDEVEGDGTVHMGDVWHFTAMPLTAYLPQPADGGENVVLTPTLSWLPGQMATAHHVYFGTDRQAVEEGTPETDKGPLELDETSYQVTEALQPDLAYYWRVDETGSGGTIQTGPVWSFSTVWPGPTGAIRQWWLNAGGGATVADLTSNPSFPDDPTGSEFVTQMEGPTNWGDNYGTRLYGWVYPPQSGDYTFWIASDDASELWLSTDEDPANKTLIASVASWTNSREWGKEPNQRSLAVKLEAGQRYYIEALMKEGGGGDNLAVAWQGPGFTMEVLGAGGVGPTPYLPVRAYAPFPADGAVDTVQSVVLAWSAGEKALQHEVYFGDDANAVAAADSSSSLFKGRQSGTNYDAGDLEWGKTFFWRVDEINTGEPESPWVGRVWNFTTANFIPVDDFESYNDVAGAGTRIYETWIDGYTDGLSGSVVGNIDPPFAEQTIVHGGAQSMPMDYDNASSPYFSQAYREFAPLMDWTGNGVTDLSLWVRGWQAPVADVTETSGKMTVSAEGADIWGTADQFTFVYKTLNGDGSLIARVADIGAGSSNWTKGGVMIRDSLDAGSASAQMVLTGGDGNGAAFQNRATIDLDMNANDATSNTTAAEAVAPPYWVKIERTGDTFAGYLSADGTAWTQLGVSQYIAMEAPAYIGICVTSHAAGTYRTFEFDNIQATGAGGAWQTKEVGLTRNSQQPLYVIVEDSSGKQVTVVDPNASVNATTWTEWEIPLSDLAGVDLSKVKRLYIGVGDTANPAADGTGRVYIDDIRVTKPAGQ